MYIVERGTNYYTTHKHVHEMRVNEPNSIEKNTFEAFQRACIDHQERNRKHLLIHTSSMRILKAFKHRRYVARLLGLNTRFGCLGRCYRRLLGRELPGSQLKR